MRSFNPTIDANFQEYVDLQLRRNGLLSGGKEQDPEFDSVEDKMADLWEKLDDIQRQSVNGMGSDLNWMRRKGQLGPKSHSPAKVTQDERKDLVTARQSSDWHGLLHYLRICAPAMSAANLAYLRGQAYDALDLPSYSVNFYELAADLEPTNASMGLIAMQAVARVDPARGLARSEHVVASYLRFPPAVVAMSTANLLRRDDVEGRPIDKRYYRRILEDTIQRINLEPLSMAEQAMVYQLAAGGFESINDLPSALKCYEDGLRLAPNNEVLLIGKGLLLYGTQTEQAVAAFRRVVSNEGTPLVWPYLFLAHYNLLQKDYDDSLQMAQLAWPRAKKDAIKADLLEWQAICLSEAGNPPELVRPWFEKALSLDPSNDRIKRNFQAFEGALFAGRERSWDIKSEDMLRVEIANLDLLAAA